MWINEIHYQGGTTNPDIAKIVKSKGLSGLTIIADSAEPKSITELKNLGLRVESARKGNDSIRLGIDVLRRYRWHVTRGSVNVRKELANYKWQEGPDGEPTNKPIDVFNHALDAIRYVAINRLFTPPQHKKKYILEKI